MSDHDKAIYLNHMLDYAVEAHRLADGRSRVELDSDRLFMLATTRLLEMMEFALRIISGRSFQLRLKCMTAVLGDGMSESFSQTRIIAID